MKKSLLLGLTLSKSLPWLLVLGGAVPAHAKQTGQNFACVNCHEGRDPPVVVANFSAPRVEPGQSVDLTVTTTHDTALVGGILVDSFGVGSFEIVDPAETHFFEDTPTQVTHAMPKPYTDGQVEFAFTWLAPSTVGPVEFEIWANAANDDLEAHDDSASGITAYVAVGCDGLWYYPDADGDGAGEEEAGVFSCDPVPDSINQGGDCDDENPAVNSNVTEVCNDIDDNCDGTSDEGFEKVLFATDVDGDGYGSLSGETAISCMAPPGFGVGLDDCDDMNPAVHPGAIEAINGIDDNCDGQRDEVPGASGGAGGTTATLGGSGGTLAAGGAMPMAAGGSIAAPVGDPQVPSVAPSSTGGAPSVAGTTAPGPAVSSGADSGGSCTVRKFAADSTGGAPIILAGLALLAQRRRARRREVVS